MTCSDDDMIRRGDAIELARKQCLLSVDDLRALPAVQVAVKPLEWVDFADRGAKAQAWNDANYMIQKWSDGRWEISASYPGHSTALYGIDRFHPTIEAAKAAAQADYEARIRSSLTAQPSPDVAAPADALEWAMSHVSSLPMDEASQSEFLQHRAALARVKGGA